MSLLTAALGSAGCSMGRAKTKETLMNIGMSVRGNDRIANCGYRSYRGAIAPAAPLFVARKSNAGSSTMIRTTPTVLSDSLPPLTIGSPGVADLNRRSNGYGPSSQD